MLDVRLVANDERGKRKRGDEQREAAERSCERPFKRRRRWLRSGHHGAVRCWSLRLAFHACQDPTGGAGRTDRAQRRPDAAARLYGGVPNAALGIVYYVALAVAVWTLRGPVTYFVFAAPASRPSRPSFWRIPCCSSLRSCPYCWTAHVVNWALAAIFATRASGPRGDSRCESPGIRVAGIER